MNPNPWFQRLMALGLCLAGAMAQAQVFPERPLRLLVPFGPGSGPDVLARELAPRMAQDLGQPVVVENRPGGGGNVTIQAMLNEPKDGHVMLLATDSMFSLNPFLFPTTFDVMQDVRLVAPISESGLFLAANAKTGVANLAQLVELIRANPGKYNYSAPTGTPHHMAGERLTRDHGLRWERIAYRDPQQGLTEMLNGMVPFGFTTLPLLEGFVREGSINLVAVATAARLPQAPEVATFAETMPGFVESAWNAIAVSDGVPEDRVERLRQAVVAARDSDAVRQRLSQLGMVPLTLSPAKLRERTQTEAQARQALIRDRNITVQ